MTTDSSLDGLLAMALHRPVPRRARRSGSRQLLTTGTRSTSAAAPAASGKRPTPAPTGATSPTASSPPPPSARSRSRPPIRMSSTPAPARRRSASTSPTATASTRAPTPGRTWTNVGLRDTRHIGKIRVHPHDPDTVWVAALGHAFGPNKERGVFKSTDGGATWRQVLFVSDKAGAVDLTVDPANPRILYAGDLGGVPHLLADQQRRPGQRALAQPRRRRDLGEHLRPPRICPSRHLGQDRRGRLRRDPRPGLGADRAQDRGRALPHRRSRPNVGEGLATTRTCSRAPGTTPTSPPIRRTPIRSTSTTSISGRAATAARPSRRSPRRTATTTICGSIRSTTRA